MIDIGTKSDNSLGKKLSNFHNWGFTFDGIECKSIESVLQAFKFKDIDEQRKLCKMIGYYAKLYGMKKGNSWKEFQILHWNGIIYFRQSPLYQRLLDSLFWFYYSKNAKAKKTLLATEDEILTHSMGNNDPKDTVLTEDEFVSRLMKLREKLRS